MSAGGMANPAHTELHYGAFGDGSHERNPKGWDDVVSIEGRPRNVVKELGANVGGAKQQLRESYAHGEIKLNIWRPTQEKHKRVDDPTVVRTHTHTHSHARDPQSIIQINKIQ